MHLLIIEDDLDLGRSLQQALKTAGITSEWFRRAADAPLDFDGMADCVLLDLSLPDGAGLDLLRRWRRQSINVPVIIMTAHSSIENRLTGLDEGADDFITKPFVTAELISRIRAVLRRYARQSHEVWRIGDLQIEPHGFQARIGAEPLDLSPREFRLLVELAHQAGAVVSKGLLAQRLEPLGEAVTFDTLEVHMSNLRRKIGASRIRTVRGVGYMLLNP